MARNFHLRAPDSLNFDIYILHTNPGTEFKFASAQYFFRFNPDVANGGTLKYRIIGSDLPSSMWPRNPTVTGNELRLAANIIPAKGDAPVISSNFPGTMIVRLSLKTSASSFSPGQPFDIRWRNSDDPPLFTKVSAFIGSLVVEITTPATHSVDTTTIGIHNISTNIPKEYNVFQNYPNPFNPTTNIKFDIPKQSKVNLKVFGILGKEIATLVNEELNPGTYEANFDASIFQAEFISLQNSAGNL
jgi:hypothetical protein